MRQRQLGAALGHTGLGFFQRSNLAGLHTLGGGIAGVAGNLQSFLMQLHALLPGQHLGKGGTHIGTQTGAGGIQLGLHQIAAMLGSLHPCSALAADFYGLVPLQRHGAGFASRVFLRIGQLRIRSRPALNDGAFAGGHGLRSGTQTGVVLHGQSQCGLQAHRGRRGRNGWRLLRPAQGC